MLDPDLYDIYKTDDDRIDEDWIVQSNPPCAFKVEEKAGCDALLTLLQADPGLHATKGQLYFMPPAGSRLQAPHAEILKAMAQVVRTAERELKSLSQSI